jgi:hypothetical protein
MNYTSGRFIGWDDSNKITTLTTEQVGNSYWKVQYALGDVVVTPIEEVEEEKPSLTGKTVKVTVDGVEYEATIK